MPYFCFLLYKVPSCELGESVSQKSNRRLWVNPEQQVSLQILGPISAKRRRGEEEMGE